MTIDVGIIPKCIMDALEVFAPADQWVLAGLWLAAFQTQIGGIKYQVVFHYDADDEGIMVSADYCSGTGMCSEAFVLVRAETFSQIPDALACVRRTVGMVLAEQGRI